MSCFKVYDVRGEIGINIDANICYRIGFAFGKVLKIKDVAIGWDARETSPGFAASVAEGLIDAGVDVLELGLCGTEEMYFAVSHYALGGGIQVTASHNPINFNGLKMVKSKSRPLDPGTDFLAIKHYAEKLAKNTLLRHRKSCGLKKNISNNSRKAYIEKIISLVDVASFRNMKIVVNSGNGAAGPTFDAIEEVLKYSGSRNNFVKVNHSPDSTFPNGIPNPMLKENQNSTSEAVVRESADLGIAFDGDFDRCFFFDEHGRFVQGEYIIGLLADLFLIKNRNETIVHDPRVIWNIKDVIESRGGKSLLSRTGHAFVKKVMKDSKSIYGAELSGHHYFRDFFYCDSGMLPWLFICELIGRSGKSLSNLLQNRITMFPSSLEKNFVVSNPKEVIKKITKLYQQNALNIDHLDGVSITMSDWRLNLRISNTESLIRLNIEGKGKVSLVKQKVSEVSTHILDT
tara:strand:- start:1466 stop:2842 length:1377 start_codon:yes stop_codon:yes gene_type:complete